MRKKNSLILFIFIIIVVIVGGSIWYYKGNPAHRAGQLVASSSVNNPGNVPVLAFVPSQAATVSVTGFSYGGWSNYENATGSFSLLCPPKYTPSTTYSGDNINVSILPPAPYEATPLFMVQTYAGEDSPEFYAAAQSEFLEQVSDYGGIVTTSSINFGSYPAVKAIFYGTSQPRTEYFISLSADQQMKITEFYNTAYTSSGTQSISIDRLQSNQEIANEIFASLKIGIVPVPGRSR